MTDRYPARWIAGGLIASVALHVLIILPLLTQSLAAESHAVQLEEDYDAVHLPEPTKPDPLHVGIDQSDAATLTWIGYQQYQRHLAQLAESEQAAFDAGAPHVTPSSPPPPPPPVTAQVQPTLEQTPIPQPAVDSTDPDRPAPSPPDQPSQPPAPTADPSPPATPPTTPRPDPVPIPPTPPTPPTPVAPEDDPGTADDQDADPTSTFKVPRDHWVTGRPVAQEGIELKPRKPDFSVLQRLTSRRPGDVACELVFDRTGRPASARLMTSTGNTDIDFVILSNLYRWRARGDRIDALEPGETITLPIVLSFRSP